MNPEVLKDLVHCRGVASWTWYYPHHYAPMVSDMKDAAGVNVALQYGEPFLPFEQLLAVLPSASHKLLPAPFTVRHSPHAPGLEHEP